MLRLLYWQAPVILNPHLSTGNKDSGSARICLEPLADFDRDGNGIPFLAAEMPTLENGGIAADGLSIIWKLRTGVTWHDGEAFDADDVRFTYEYAINPETPATSAAYYRSIQALEVIDSHTVKLSFNAPNPGAFEAFTGAGGMILPEHIFRDFTGLKAPDAPANLTPIGTGPYKVREFNPGDLILFDINPDYWDTGKPFFDTVELKGGGDATSAARAVLQTGEVDWSTNLQVESRVLEDLAQGGPGVIVSTPGRGSERLFLNFADPNTEIDGARSEPSTQHPLLSQLPVRQALNVAVQREAIATQLYGVAGRATANNLNAPEKFQSPNTSWKYDLDEARSLLANAGVSGGNLLYQTTVNPVRQKTQEIVKQDFEAIGFSVEIKAIEASVFFSADPGNPDTSAHFYADIEMYSHSSEAVYPIDWGERFRTDQIASKANNWTGRNIARYDNPEFDRLHDQARVELNPERQAELFIAMNDLTVSDVVEIPMVHRGNVSGANKSLSGYHGWAGAGTDFWDIKDWIRE